MPRFEIIQEIITERTVIVEAEDAIEALDLILDTQDEELVRTVMEFESIPPTLINITELK